ncbi:hypothetical protein C1H46_025038 [Malus baccata]|uniref:7-deoxyloganetic acid glucosyltransferase n=1 Tax=Malus baccata TaxID=106549 RepID=A0A540LSD1_MALBA|nr:hypothetical protein C1H46_025038 [Malus baccata]
MELDQIRATDPHVLFFPLPLQSHDVTTSLKLAELLYLANFHITFLNSEFVHNRLLRYTNVQSHFANYPRFRFKTITDGLPEHHPRAGAQMIDMFESLSCVTKPLFREMAVSAQSGLDSSWPPLTCIVADGVVNFATEIAKEIGVMAVSFRTISASAYWAYLCVPKMVESCELPFKVFNKAEPRQCRIRRGHNQHVRTTRRAGAVSNTESHPQHLCRRATSCPPKLKAGINRSTTANCINQSLGRGQKLHGMA